jgi:L-ascorbate metabolism protein UlaG (beta-lactamase superfamily)
MYIFLGITAGITLTSFVVLNLSRFGKQPSGERLERMKASPHFKNGVFENQSYTPTFSSDKSKFRIFVSMIFGKRVRTSPKNKIPSVKTDLSNLDPDQDILVWFGHSSYFIQTGNKKILVDPVLSGHASPFSGIINAFDGSDSYRATDIPSIDYLLITHDHWDHLDINTIREIEPRTGKIFCGLGVGAHLEHWGVDAEKIIEMDWYENTDLQNGFMVHAMPTRHFSGRGLKRNGTLWLSFVWQTPSKNIYIGGDSGYDKHFAEIGEKFGPFDLVILEQGQYDQRWKHIHLLPDEVLLAAQDLKARRLMPVHNSKFALAAHPWDEPLRKLTENNRKIQLPLLTPIIGEAVDLNDTTRVFERWWENVD